MSVPANIHCRPVKAAGQKEHHAALTVTSPHGSVIEYHLPADDFLTLIARMVKTYEQVKELNANAAK